MKRMAACWSTRSLYAVSSKSRLVCDVPNARRASAAIFHSGVLAG